MSAVQPTITREASKPVTPGEDALTDSGSSPPRLIHTLETSGAGAVTVPDELRNNSAKTAQAIARMLADTSPGPA